MAGLSLTNIASVFKDIAQRHTHNLPYRRINTFAVLDSLADVAEPNMAKTDRDKSIGHLWTRYQDCRDICLVIMQESRNYKESGEKCISLFIGVAQEPKCDECPQKIDKTPDEVDTENEDILLSLIHISEPTRPY